MKSRNILILISLGFSAFLGALGFVVLKIWPHISQTLRETFSAFQYACQSVLSDLNALQILTASLGFALLIFLASRAVRIFWQNLTFTKHYLKAKDNQFATKRIQNLLPLLKLERSEVKVVADKKPFALTAGLLRPKIFLSVGALNALTDLELLAVLQHEQHHLRQQEPRRRLWLNFLTVFLPGQAAKRNLRDIYISAAEIEADQQAKNQVQLGQAILKMAEPQVGAVGFSPLAVRVERLLNENYKFRPMRLYKYLAGVFLVSLGMLIFAPKGLAVIFQNHPSASTAQELQICKQAFLSQNQPLKEACNKQSALQTCAPKSE
ncbi:hypothetical protein C4546_00030 [Candidatus Parcubacteria bacterium]|jgi:hypothetical protein|nr:MAG: hypothetical protein C4546_00030 [Candidatus Parcubacteria bacterium]